MANKTTNYNLTKPLESEFYDVGVQNENMDKIDTQMKANADAIKDLQDGQSGKADLVEGKVPAEQLPDMEYDPAGTADGAVKAHNEDDTAHPYLLKQIRTCVTAEAVAAHNSANDAHKEQFEGKADLDDSGKVVASQLPDMDYIPTSEKGGANGVATLGADGKVPEGQIPSVLSALSRLHSGLGNEYVWEKYKPRIEPVSYTSVRSITLYNQPQYTGGTGVTTTIYFANSFDDNLNLVNPTSISFTYNNVEGVLASIRGKYVKQTLTQTSIFVPQANSVITKQLNQNAGPSYQAYCSNCVEIYSTVMVKDELTFVNSQNRNTYPPAVSDDYSYEYRGQLGNLNNVVSGYYMGNGAASQHIDLGFAPKAVIISSSRGQTYLNGDAYGGVYVRLDGGVPDQYPGAKLDDTGFTVYLSSTGDQYTNMNNYRYHYIAFC